MTGVTICMTTWKPPGEDGEKREEAALQAIRSWQSWLRPTEGLSLFIGDDFSADVDYPVRLKAEWDTWIVVPRNVFPSANIGIAHRLGVGATLNMGVISARGRGDLVLYVVDDWMLTQILDLAPWIYALETNPEIGCIRLGPPHPNTRGEVVAISDAWNGWALDLDRISYAASLRPALYHQRFFDYYGPFKEGVSSYGCEDDLRDRYNHMTGGPKVVLALPHPWMHIETCELAGVVPG